MLELYKIHITHVVGYVSGLYVHTLDGNKYLGIIVLVIVIFILSDSDLENGSLPGSSFMQYTWEFQKAIEILGNQRLHSNFL